MRKVAVFVGSRANYSSVKSVMQAINRHPSLTLQVLVGASAVLGRYGEVAVQIQEDGFEIADSFHTLVEGETPATMAKSTGLGLIEVTGILDRLEPDVVLVVGDRFEVLSIAVASAYMNIPLAHTMGGEVSGTIDESIRHAITKFSNIHFPSSEDARQRVIRLGEREDTVHMVGCPRIDLVAEVLESSESDDFSGILSKGVGENVDLDQPFLLVSQHSVTSEYSQAESQINATLQACQSLGLPAIVLWPNADAGSDGVSKGIRKFRERGFDADMHFFKNLRTEDYIKLMSATACLVGNSSSGIREGAFIGTPVVNLGTRQNRRQRGKNVVDAQHTVPEITRAIKEQLDHGHYEREEIYGAGNAGVRIADILSKTTLETQKTIAY